MRRHLVAGGDVDDYGHPETKPIAKGARAVFISDFLGDWDGIVTGVSRVADQDVQGALVQVLDPQELEFPFKGRTVFESMKGTLSFEARRANGMRDAYLNGCWNAKMRCGRWRDVRGWRFFKPPNGTVSAQAALLWIYAALRHGRDWVSVAIFVAGVTKPANFVLVVAGDATYACNSCLPCCWINAGVEERRKHARSHAMVLLLLRLLAVAAVIIGFAGPVMNPVDRITGSGRLLIAMDASWASAQDWPHVAPRWWNCCVKPIQVDRPVAVQRLSDLPRGELAFRSGNDWLADAQGDRAQMHGHLIIRFGQMQFKGQKLNR